MQLEIRNYYEVLLMELLSDEGLLDELPEDYLAVLCCVTLNQLPVRYIRHLVDTYFFEDYSELSEMRSEIQTALRNREHFSRLTCIRKTAENNG